MPRITLIALIVCLATAGAAAARAHRAFYLSVRTRECLIAAAGTGNTAYKTVVVVPCSDPAHNLEVYGIGHGGWGYQTPPPVKTVLAIMRTTCLAIYQRVTGHPLGRTSGWDGFAPDAGRETRLYGDKIVCSLRSWPGFGPLGAGWHVR